MDDEVLKDVNPGFPKAAAGFTLFAGALGILSPVTTLLHVIVFARVLTVVLYVHMALGAALIVFARNVFLARPWAAFGAIGVGSALALLSGAWLVFAIANGFFTLFAFWAPAAALLAVALCVAALAPCRRAEVARGKLRAEGMSLGL